MSSLDDIILALRELGTKDVEIRIAAAAAPLLQDEIESTLGAGQDPEGRAWAPRKAGGRAYVNASAKVRTTNTGDLVRMTLVGPEVYGNYGARGMPVRRMIPDAGANVPSSVTTALTRAAEQVFNEVTK